MILLFTAQYVCRFTYARVLYRYWIANSLPFFIKCYFFLSKDQHRYHHHYHQRLLTVRTPLNPPLALSSLILCRSSRWHSVSAKIWWMWDFFTGWLTLVCLFVVVHIRTLIMLYVPIAPTMPTKVFLIHILTILFQVENNSIQINITWCYFFGIIRQFWYLSNISLSLNFIL